MDNEEIVMLLREIRDLQKAHAENYKDAIKNQQTALEVQAKAARIQKVALLVVGIVFVVVVMGFAVLVSLTRWNEGIGVLAATERVSYGQDWFKIRNPGYSQYEGRRELFEKRTGR